MTSRQQRRSLEEAIVDTIREPLIVLDDAVRVASRSLYRGFVTTKPRAVPFTNWVTTNGTSGPLGAADGSHPASTPPLRISRSNTISDHRPANQ